MTEGATPSRLSIAWSLEAQADLRAIDRQTALDILHCLDRYLATRSGDVKKLKPPMTGFRLRCGDYRVFFKQAGEHGTHVERLYPRLAPGKGQGRAGVAIARHLAEASYWVLGKRQPYKDPAPRPSSHAA